MLHFCVVSTALSGDFNLPQLLYLTYATFTQMYRSWPKFISINVEGALYFVLFKNLVDLFKIQKVMIFITAWRWSLAQDKVRNSLHHL